MNKIYAKLIAITITLVLSVSVVVMSSYAWLVLSASPVATGIQVTIGGGNTILVAPDMTQVVDGETYHYPGRFSDTMNFSRHDSYDYLKDLGGLTPVSTADGVHWFLPEYYRHTDPEVQEGKALTGELKPLSEFKLDEMLHYANLIKDDDEEQIQEGSYIYLDFWVVSPGSNITLRLSTGNDSGGSFLLDALQAVQTEDGYALKQSESKALAAVRLGFLANPIRLTDDSMLHYQNSLYYDQQYTSLQGMYLEPDSGHFDMDSNRFTIYEPNCDTHPNGGADEGSYVVTEPVGLVDGKGAAVSVSDRVTAQLTSRWTSAESGTGTEIEQRFQAAVLNMDKSLTASEIQDTFYNSYLQGQISPYVDKGEFIKNTRDLYSFSGSISREDLSQLDTEGATEDVYIIELERNVPQRIRMFIWLEGQDVDCVNAVDASSFIVNIELAGSNIA